MSDGLTISLATPEDARALTALRASIARTMTAEYGTGEWSTIPSRSLVLRQMRASRVLVARRADKVIGTVRLATALPALFDSSAFTPARSALYVLGLAVDPAERGAGVARALMETAKETARASRADALWLDVYDHAAGAGKFYEKCGFTRVGAPAGQGAPLVFYEWLRGAA